MLAPIPGLADLSLTTNGYLLERDADALVEAGIRRVNVSIDSLARDRFFQITRRDALPQVLRGLEAIGAPRERRPIKVNAIAMRDFTEREVSAFAELARSSDYQVRFIEFMPLDADQAWTPDSVLTGAEIRTLIEREHELIEVPREPSATARVYPLRRRCRGDRLHQPRQRALLRGLQPPAPDRRGQAPHLPLLDPRDRPPRTPPRRRRRGRARADHPRRRLAQGAQASRRRAGLPPAAEVDERHRRLNNSEQDAPASPSALLGLRGVAARQGRQGAGGWRAVRDRSRRRCQIPDVSRPKSATGGR